jgi:hypothetical protein
MPYVWLPVILVTAAIAGHVLVTCELLSNELLNND